MKTINISLKNQSYQVLIGKVLNNLLEYLEPKKSVLIITDQKVADLHLKQLTSLLQDYQIYVYNLGDAEANKNLAKYEDCVLYALDNYLNRDLQVIAFGGGAVGDFAGFFAATYKRGVSFINVPTTLLAHDSAVGGKVGINVGGIKNVVGTFYQPKVVIYHTEFLNTLDFTEIKSGFGEIFKHDLLSTGNLMSSLKASDLSDIIHDEDLINKIIYDCIQIKQQYIVSDIEDKLGIRQALNLGHTLAHAIEILYGLKHGEAVAFGICFDLYLAGNRYYEDYYKQLRSWGYFNDNFKINTSKIIDVIKNDKKNKTGLITFIGLKKLGEPYEIQLSENEVAIKIQEFLNLIRKW